MLIMLRMVSGVLYLKLVLRRIETNKNIFALKMDLGLEALIPKELSQDNLPLTFRFYDPLFQILYQQMSAYKRSFYLNNERQLRLDSKLNLKYQLKKFFSQDKNMLSVKNDTCEYVNDPLIPLYQKSLQRSNYLTVNTELEYTRNQQMQFASKKTIGDVFL